ncbi:hypothetical protein YC2023_042448 [Brassica napus]
MMPSTPLAWQLIQLNTHSNKTMMTSSKCLFLNDFRSIHPSDELVVSGYPNPGYPKSPDSDPDSNFTDPANPDLDISKYPRYLILPRANYRYIGEAELKTSVKTCDKNSLLRLDTLRFLGFH